MKDLVYILWDDLDENIWLHSSAKITNILDLTSSLIIWLPSSAKISNIPDLTIRPCIL